MTQTQAFAQRLQTRLCEQRLGKAQAVRWLATVCGCSVQMARRYWSGTALPKPAAILTLAQQLHVRASWLYFGEGQSHVDSDTLSIHPEVLTYLLHTLLPDLSVRKQSDTWIDPLCTLLTKLDVETPAGLNGLKALHQLLRSL
ncbi:TPA: hypothetical protein ACXYK5_002738 [Legionella pneumophila]